MPRRNPGRVDIVRDFLAAHQAIRQVWLFTALVLVAGASHAAQLDVDQNDGGCSDVVGTPYCTIGAAADDAVSLNPKDRWGGTPLDDAYLQRHDEIVAVLEQAGARRGRARAR